MAQREQQNTLMRSTHVVYSTDARAIRRRYPASAIGPSGVPEHLISFKDSDRDDL